MGFYDGTSKAMRTAAAGFGICAVAFLFGVVASYLEWIWLRYVALSAMLAGIGVGARGVILGWREIKWK